MGEPTISHRWRPGLLTGRGRRPGAALSLGVVACSLVAAGVGVAEGPGKEGPLSVRVAPLATVLAEVKAPGARAVLVNVWATWCEPCRDELPDILRFHRDHAAQGLRLVMVSADDEDRRAEVTKVLSAAAAPAGLDPAASLIALIKREDDTVFVNGLDRRWSGALPATFLFDGRGGRKHSWLEAVTYGDLEKQVPGLLTSPPSKIKNRAPRRTP